MSADGDRSVAMTCPLCGGPNGCRMAADDADILRCWCSDAHIAAAVLERIPPAQRGTSCVCERCAADDRRGWPTLLAIVTARLARIRRDR